HGEGTVLVVDDDPGVRRVASRLLESFGLRVRVAESGPEALALISADGDAVDAVLLDLTMPEMSGPETFERLQDLPPGLPVVLMGGCQGEEVGPEIDARISGFIQRPSTPTDLARRTGAALAAARPAGERARGSRRAAPASHDRTEASSPAGRDRA